MALVIGDEHAPVAREADRDADAARGKLGEQFRLRGSRSELADRSLAAEVHRVEHARRINRRSFDPKSVFVACQPPALEQRLRDRGGRDERDAKAREDLPLARNSHRGRRILR